MSVNPVQAHDIQIIAERWLSEITHLSQSNRQSLGTLAVRLVSRIEKQQKISIGIAGAPGTGKSTLARLLTHCLEKTGIPACSISLDDYYLDRRQRDSVAKTLHPLFRHRGVPGTHELNRLLRDLDRIKSGDIDGLHTPVFNKSRDDREPRHLWRPVTCIPRVTFLEGWFVGAPPPSGPQTHEATSEFERTEDPEITWRFEVLDAWQQYDRGFRSRLDELWYIHVPDWNCVVDWRWQQELELAVRHLRSRKEVEHFLGTFERIVIHMQKSYAEWADLCLSADRDHNIKILN